MELLKQLYAIHSPSGAEKKMRHFLKTWIRRNVPEARYSVDNFGNLYVTKGDAETYPCIVAHMDQVQSLHPKDFRTLNVDGILIGFSVSKRCQCGLGADDKNGIWIALKALKKFDAIKTAFFVSEEVGCLGSQKADMKFFEDCRFVIQPDRRGSKDLITSIGWTELCSGDFLEDIGYEQFGYKPTDGMLTDVLTLKENGLAVSAINLSCGYHKPHTDEEYTVWSELENCKNFIFHIIETCNKVYPHIAEEPENYLMLMGDDVEMYLSYLEELISDYLMYYPEATDLQLWEEYGDLSGLSPEKFFEVVENVKQFYQM